MREMSKGQKLLLALFCLGALVSLWNIALATGPSADHELIRSPAVAPKVEDKVVSAMTASKSDSADEPMLDMNDIVKNLLAETGATGWGTNIPSYIFGLARGSGDGQSALGIALGDVQGNQLSVLASDCESIEWTDHDGKSFGSQELTLKGIASQVKIDFMRIEESVFFKISDVKDKLVVVSLEEMEVLPTSLDRVQFEDPSDKSQWVLAANIDATFPAVVVSGISPSSKQSVWKSPVEILTRVKDEERSKQSGVLTPRGISLSFGDVQSSAFLIFKPGDSIVFKLFRNTHSSFSTSQNDKIEFPAAEFEEKREAFRKSFVSEYQRKAVSNLLGNLGRFAGNLVVDNADRIVDLYTDRVTLTAIGPSRTMFPRGFLWDEGFHVLAIDDVNHAIAVEIVTGWLRLQQVTEQREWIPRELALSERDKARIPAQFLAQNPLVANPPTLLFVIRKWINSNVLSEEAVVKIGAHLVRWLRHVEKTQKSVSSSTCYRWKPRDNDHCLSSGLDDYPRGLIVNEDECHLDLHVWLMLMTDTVRKICLAGNAAARSSFCKSSSDWTTSYRDLSRSMWTVFSEPDSDIIMLADYLGEQQVDKKKNNFLLTTPPWAQDGRCGPSSVQCPPSAPCCSPFNWCGNDAAHCECPQCKRHSELPLNKRVVDGYVVKPVHSPHIGYVNLFPLMVGRLCASDPRDRAHLAFVTRTLLAEQGGLMSPFGVISLARSDPLFQSGENYWRGNVWANINLLVAGALMAYSEAVRSVDPSLAKEMRSKASDIRNRWTQHMQKAWEAAAGPREYLKPLTGEGGGAYPFAGWTAAAMALFAPEDWEKFWPLSIGFPSDCV